MRTLTNILIVVVLTVLVSMTYVQETDIQHMKYRVVRAEAGLYLMQGGLASVEGGLTRAEGGLDSVNGGLAQANTRIAELMYTPSDNEVRATVQIIGRHLDDGMKAGWGSGGFVSDNLILTAKHVIKVEPDRWGNVRERTYEVKLWSGLTIEVLSILEDADDDVALLVVDAASKYMLPLGSPPDVGAFVQVIGVPGLPMTYPTITWGRVSRENMDGYLDFGETQEELWKNDLLVVDCFTTNGNSGGPVLHDGKVVAIVCFGVRGADGLAFCTYVNDLDPDLRALFK